MSRPEVHSTCRPTAASELTDSVSPRYTLLEIRRESVSFACAGADLEKYSAAGTVIAGFHRWNGAFDHLQCLHPNLTSPSTVELVDVHGSPECNEPVELESSACGRHGAACSTADSAL